MDGANGGLHIPEGGENDGGRHVAGIAKPLQETEAIHAGHVEVREDHVGRKVIQLQKRFVAIGGGLGGHAPSRHHCRQPASLAGFVVYDKNFNGLIQK